MIENLSVPQIAFAAGTILILLSIIGKFRDWISLNKQSRIIAGIVGVGFIIFYWSIRPVNFQPTHEIISEHPLAFRNRPLDKDEMELKGEEKEKLDQETRIRTIYPGEKVALITTEGDYHLIGIQSGAKIQKGYLVFRFDKKLTIKPL